MAAYYNEFDPAAALWLRNNIAAGLIAPGEVDTRSIKEVSPDDLKGFAQHHFFAGIGGWSHAARLAGWPDDRPLWSASCPCQPFSAAGKQAGVDDARHLWPDVHRLASVARPARIVGEQVAGSLGYGWFDGVRSDLEGEGYACRAVDIPALAIDAPHERNRLYWVAVADPQGERSGGDVAQRGPEGRAVDRGIDAGSLDDPARFGRREGFDQSEIRRGRDASTGSNGADGTEATFQSRADGVTHGAGLEGQRGNVPPRRRRPGKARPAPAPDGGNRNMRNGSWWSGADWIVCHDGKARRVAKSLSSGMADGFRLFISHCPSYVLEEIRQGIMGYGASIQSGPGEVLRQMRKAILEGEAAGQAKRFYAEGSLSEAEILLSVLRECEGRFYGGWRACSGDALSFDALRGMWGDKSASCASLRRGHIQQYAEQYPDALRALSSLLASSCAAAWALFDRTYGPHLGLLAPKGPANRIAAWKGFGNAIVPPLAAEVLAALAEYLEEIR